MRTIWWRYGGTKTFAYSLIFISLVIVMCLICYLDIAIENGGLVEHKIFPIFRQDNFSVRNAASSSTLGASPSTLPYHRGLWFERADTKERDDEQNLTSKAGSINPSVLLDLLPHLRSYRYLRDLNANVLLRANNVLRSPPELLLMIPSIYRKEHNYLVDTLQNFIKSIAAEERHLAQIVVMLSENPWELDAEPRLEKAVAEIWKNFEREVLEGFLEVISPPREWFPPGLQQIHPTLGDPPERMRWRTKQSLDYAFAMYHTRVERPDARFYVQLEDDVVTVPAFLSEMRRFANAHPNFFMAEFTNLGFIGRMFHNGQDLSRLAHFILILHRQLPVDWILSQFINSNFCSLDETWKQCLKKRLTDIVLFRRSPPLFQHVGKHSSLPGKMQNLTEKNFARNTPIELLKSENPAATEFRSSLGDAQKWKLFYEQFAPIEVNGSFLQRNDRLVELVYGEPIQELKGLRILFAAHFKSNLSALPVALPNSLLRLRISHSLGNSTLPSSASRRLMQDHFLFIANSSLRGVRSVQIRIAEGQWRSSVDKLVLTAITFLR